MERSVHDSLCVVKRVMESKNVVVGGGTVEAALSIYLENFATTLSSRYVNPNEALPSMIQYLCPFLQGAIGNC